MVYGSDADTEETKERIVRDVVMDNTTSPIVFLTKQ